MPQCRIGQSATRINLLAREFIKMGGSGLRFDAMQKPQKI
jgi:hypothetical protein